jgi:hypothetical protein
MSDEDQLSTFIAGGLDESFCGVGVCRDERGIGWLRSLGGGGV